ncbi:class I SAM-dependent methyltransferase [Thermodesulfobacteriota bacterium]
MEYINLINLKHLESIRIVELERVLTEIKSEKPDGSNILEIGSGSGWQAKKLAENGYSIEAIDIEESHFSEHRSWPILKYNGKHIPFPDNYFDIVFSSNVLEHIPHLKEFQHEIKRVLKPDGIAIHVVPSGSWRFWTNIAHYVYILETIGKVLYSKIISVTDSKDYNEVENSVVTKIKNASKTELINKAICPPRHGEKGTALSEMYYFSRCGWHTIFEKTGWNIKKHCFNNLFYTGCSIFGFAISIQFRKYLSYILGSSCHIFVLAKEEIFGKHSA